MTGRSACVTVTTMEGPSGAGGPAVLLRGGRGFRRSMRLRDAVRPEADDIVWCVAEVQDNGLEAQIKLITLGDDDLPGFLRRLSEDFRGWPGIRRWRSLEDQLRIEAAHDGSGHVRLPFTVEARAEMMALADTFEAFFAAARAPHKQEPP